MAKQRSSKTQKKNEETGQSESTKSYRDRVEEFLEKRNDFFLSEGNISAVLPQGSPGPLKEEPEPEDDEE